MTLINARMILSLIHLALCTPQSYRRLLLCSPFISETLVLTKIVSKGFARLPILIITRPETARRIEANIENLFVVTVPNLHAKVYIACGKDDRDSIAIIGSFNMTNAAIDENIEIGIKLVGSSQDDRNIITKLENKLLWIAQKKSERSQL